MGQGPDDGSRLPILTISNVITVTRILLVPLFVTVLLTPWPEWMGLGDPFNDTWKSIIAALIFIVISGTDWLDGYLARSRNEVTDFGKFMDPLADKILVAAALVCLVELGTLPTWVVLIILAREFIISGVRMMAATKGEVIAASMIGKFKTVFQMIAIVLFTIKDSQLVTYFGESAFDALLVISWATMIIALALTIASMFDYLFKAREVIGFGPSRSDDAAENAEPPVDYDSEIDRLAIRCVEAAREEARCIAVAESLTGGMIGSAITSVAGSSAVFLGGFITYTNEEKRALLGVDEAVLASCGAVSEETALQMASGARESARSDIAVAVTGLAGPDGDEFGNPVGTVWIGVSTERSTTARRFSFDGERQPIRKQTVIAALGLVLADIESADLLNV